MPLLGFQEQFVEGVENGLDLLAGRPLRHMGVDPKLNTIRAYRKRPIKVGDRLHLWHKQRAKRGTPGRRKLGEAVCTAVAPIRMRSECLFVESRLLGVRQIQIFAISDGFRDAGEMFEWFDKTHGLPFEGQLIRWGDLSD